MVHRKKSSNRGTPFRLPALQNSCTFPFSSIAKPNKKATKNSPFFLQVVFSTFLVPFSGGSGILIINELQR